MSDPPQQSWVCRLCGDEGTDYIPSSGPGEYERLVAKFKAEKEPKTAEQWATASLDAYSTQKGHAAGMKKLIEGFEAAMKQSTQEERKKIIAAINDCGGTCTTNFIINLIERLP